MDSRTEEILTAFPALRYDPAFKITSRENPDYNCIAWAFGRNDCWMWPDEDADGVSLWPDPSADPEIQTFVEAFKKIGFEVCDDDGYEERTQKIALYCYVGTTECTHAARQLRNGLWTSKLGESNDIQHSSPYFIQGRLYGNVACILRRGGRRTRGGILIPLRHPQTISRSGRSRTARAAP